jgi:hypothetical protein
LSFSEAQFDRLSIKLNALLTLPHFKRTLTEEAAGIYSALGLGRDKKSYEAVQAGLQHYLDNTSGEVAANALWGYER